jgi:hypothetical protein
MAGDPHAKLREVLGLSPGVILSEDEIAKALASMAGPEANAIRAQLAGRFAEASYNAATMNLTALGLQ